MWYIVQKQAQIQAIGTYKACFSRKLSIFEKHQFGGARVNKKLGISKEEICQCWSSKIFPWNGNQGFFLGKAVFNFD